MNRCVNASDDVVAVAASGRAVGVVDRLQAHTAPGILHLAVSVQLVNADGLWIMQRRASTKRLFANNWANSCCTHPHPDETAAASAERRAREELGVTIPQLTYAGSFVYRAVDPESSMVEHEFDHVYFGVVSEPLRPSDAEIRELALLDSDRVDQLLSEPCVAPWTRDVVHLVGAKLSALANHCE